MQTLGRHLLVELGGCSGLDSLEDIQAIMEEAARQAGATIVQSVFHRFNPYGISGVVVISESHLAIHTWPEHGYASVDVYTCGDTVDPWKAYEYLREQLHSRSSSVKEFNRGTVEPLESSEAAPKIQQIAELAA